MPDIEAKDNLSPSRQTFMDVTEDLKHRRDWRSDLDNFRKLRIGIRKRNNFYPNAPNWVNPIIDDNINRITGQMVSTLLGPQYIAHFIPQNEQAYQLVNEVQAAFHNILMYGLGLEQVLETLLDMQNEAGIAFSKMVVDRKSFKRLYGTDQLLPRLVARHQFDVVCPKVTEDINNAFRICDIYRYPVETFERIGEDEGWSEGATKEAIKRFKANKDGNPDDTAGYEIMEGYNASVYSTEEIVIHEVYEEKKGKRGRVTYAVDDPDLVLNKVPWTDEEGDNKDWLHDSYRFENRANELYDTRGVASMLKDFQQASSQFMNLNGVAFDYYGYPMLVNKGGGTIANQTFSPRPGGIMPPGLEPARLPEVSPQFNFNQDRQRSLASLRVGSTASAFSAEEKKNEKTATEANIQSLNSQVLNLTNVMRFTRSLSSALNKMWRFFQKNKTPLPIVNQNKQTFSSFDQVQEQQNIDIYSLPYLIVSSANSRNYDPIFKQQQLIGGQPYFIGNQFVKQDVLAEYIASQIDPLLAEELVVKQDGGTAPIEQQLEQLTQAVQQIGQFVGAHQKYIEADSQAQEIQEQESQQVVARVEEIGDTVLDHDKEIIQMKQREAVVNQ